MAGGERALREKWRAARIKELDAQVEQLLAENMSQAQTIEALQARVRFDLVRAEDECLEVRLYKALQPGSTTCTLSELMVVVAARAIRVVGVDLQEVRSSTRLAGHASSAAAVAGSARGGSMQLSDESLLAIRAEMPTSSDDWEVKAVLEYRVRYGTEQWLLKWKGYRPDRNTWEPWEHLITEQVEGEARQFRDGTVSRADEAGLMKLTSSH